MRYVFVMLPEFDKQWAKLGLTDDDLKRLQCVLLDNPQGGDLVQGTGGLRKLRFAFSNRGKSGSIRVAYVEFPKYSHIFLITTYAKKDKENLTQSECNSIKQVITVLAHNLERQWQRYCNRRNI